MIILKICPKCNTKQPVDRFHKDPSRKDDLSFYCKSCKKAYHKDNKEKLVERAKKWNEGNPERAAGHRKKWLSKNMEKVKEYAKNRVFPPGHQKEQSRRRREKNPELMREYRRRSEKKNPQAKAIRENRRRAIKIAAPGTGVSRREWQEVLRQQGGKCLRCGTSDDLSMDHVVPLVKGGADDPDNIQVLCRPCNSKKGIKTIDYRSKDYKAAILKDT